VTETSAATSALRSGTAIRLMLVVGLGWLVARYLLVRYSSWPLLRLVVFASGAAVILDVVVLPAYDDETVVESLPPAEALPAAPPSSQRSCRDLPARRRRARGRARGDRHPAGS